MKDEENTRKSELKLRIVYYINEYSHKINSDVPLIRSFLN